MFTLFWSSYMRDEQNPVYSNNIEKCFDTAKNWPGTKNLVWEFDGDGWSSNLVGVGPDEHGWSREFGKWYITRSN